ncbi:MULTISPECIES: hypothetical protein [unclassified Shinella]|uniref:baseplate hub protein n=1 Tax=unclassified Shinella TaxID=2643062 RepID=UPI00225D9B6E|nr:MULTISPECIES: hypothetical protein [unclassified Shinella]MCO5137425.1 hypothetical protein [Shinella sp.]MDC7257397.1 hypothetical protein [Shinella sp. YE25]CAI0340290.1 conserved hypothetical protein [Rhizobiaceae bacterium]CAK7258662.1 conserved protein of unknown function [Shinella sp. WSC3-e]
MAFSQKRIEVTFTLATGSFEGGGNSYSAAGLRTSCSGTVVGGQQINNFRMAIFGLPLDVMNQLSNVGPRFQQTLDNRVTVTAGDDVSGMHVVFEGNIYHAMVDATAMPQVAFLVEAKTGYFHQVKPATPLSIRGSADVAGMMSQIAGQLGMSFENNGVTAKLANPYYAGSLVQQATAIARDAGIVWVMERNVLAINNPGDKREGETVLISPQTGLIGYPLFNQQQIILKSAFNPAVKFQGEIEVKSDIEPANGKWIVNALNYELEAEMPQGKWHMDIVGTIAGSTVAGG